MSLLVISPDFASHYEPLAVLARAANSDGHRVVVATGLNIRQRAEADGFEWRLLQLGAGSNTGVAARDPSIERFIAATAEGPLATIRRQALDREKDLLWQPEQVSVEIARLYDEIDPERVLVDHVSFASTLGMYAAGRSFVTLVPGHPSQLPIGTERYGIPAIWPRHIRPDPHQLAELEHVVDRVTGAFTARWNSALATVSPGRAPIEDAFRAHGFRVLYNSIAEMQAPSRSAGLPHDHRYVGPLVRHEQLPAALSSWSIRADNRPQVYVALGTFLSHRSDVLVSITKALQHLGVRAAVATGATPVEQFGPLPKDWVVAAQLPQVAMLRSADLIVHHGGNNSAQEALAAGVRQLVLPFSTDQFSNGADLERIGAASVLPPNEATVKDLALAIKAAFTSVRRPASKTLTNKHLVEAVFG
ncbi:MAG: nucleotide disphospho-sugar-binding domain-containing protein [Halioglobus sp.]